MTKKERKLLLRRLWRDGFDLSRPSVSGGVRVGCSQCAALAINGTACHENGCPNQKKRTNTTR